MSIIPFSISSRIKKVFGILCLIAGGIVIGYALAHAQTASTAGTSGTWTITEGTGTACEIRNGRAYFIVPGSTERIDIGSAGAACADPRSLTISGNLTYSTIDPHPVPAQISVDPRPSAATLSLLPDPQLTPGAIRLTDAATICKIKWGADRRHVTAKMKREVCSAYGIAPADCTGKNYEIDHLIPRELGGADDVKNLWPQPWPEARMKDRLENWLHKSVCAGPLDSPYLGIVQKFIATDWYSTYLGVFGATK